MVFAPAGPRSISKSAIIDERGIKISEDLIYFCDLGSPFSEKKRVIFNVRVVKY